MCSGKTHFIQNKLYFDNYYDYQALIPLPIESLMGGGGKFDAGYKRLTDPGVNAKQVRLDKSECCQGI